MSRIRCSQPKSRQRIRHNIRSRCQVFPGCRSQIHNTFNTGQHILRLPSGHCHVIHGICRLSRRKLCLGTHLPGPVPETVKIRSRCPGHSRHLTHRRIKISGSFHRRRSKPCHHSRHRKQLLTHGRNLVSNRLQLFTGRSDLLQRSRRLVRLLFQTPQSLLRLNNLPLQGIILVLGNRSVPQCLIRLLLCSLQSFQLLPGLRNRLCQQPVLLCDQLRIPRIQLQKLLHIFQLALRIPDLRINPFQGSLQFRGIAANLDSDPPDSVPCHTAHPLNPIKRHKNTRITPGTKKAPAIPDKCFHYRLHFFINKTGSLQFLYRMPNDRFPFFWGNLSCIRQIYFMM